MTENEWRSVDGYAWWLERNMGLVGVAVTEQASKTIQGLKAMKRHGGE